MRNLLLTLGFLLPILLSSCVSRRYVHNPVAVNNPFFTAKHDSRIGAFISGGSNSDSNYNRGFDILAAYAVSDHVAITGSFFKRHEQNTYDNHYIGPFDTSLVTYRRKGWEVGAGCFAPLDPQKHFSLNLYGGIGSGSLRIHEQGTVNGAQYTRFHESTPFKIYVQPGLNLSSSFIRFGMAYRLNFLHYKNITTDLDQDEQEGLRLNGLKRKRPMFSELQFELQFIITKASWLTFESQLSLCSDAGYYQSRVLNGSAGFSIDMYRVLKPH